MQGASKQSCSADVRGIHKYLGASDSWLTLIQTKLEVCEMLEPGQTLQGSLQTSELPRPVQPLCCQTGPTVVMSKGFIYQWMPSKGLQDQLMGDGI